MELSEWKKAKKKDVTLKSGLDVQVRQLSPFALAELGPIPQLEQLEDSSAENQIKAAKRIVQAGLVKPKLGEGDDELSLADLSIEDINEIIEAVMGIGRRPGELPLGGGSSEGQTQS